MKAFLCKYRHLLWMAMFAVTSTLYFAASRMQVTPLLVHTPLDDRIPFLPVFVLPYIVWYAYVPALMIWTGIRDKTRFYHQCITMFSGALVCVLIYYFFPTAIDFRPTAEGDGLLLWICRFMYHRDLPRNVCPSLHCFEAMTAHLTAFACPALRRHRVLRRCSAILTLLICLSTVFIKQHAVPDLICGVALAVGLYLLLYKVLWRDMYARATF